MIITPRTKIFIVNNAYSDEELGDLIHKTTLVGLQLRLASGLDIQKDNVVIHTSKKTATDDAKLRLKHRVCNT